MLRLISTAHNSLDGIDRIRSISATRRHQKMLYNILYKTRYLRMATRIPKRIGKAQAREEFSALIEAVASGAGAVEITDYGKVAAVLLSEKEYEWLCASAKNNAPPKRNPRGFFVLADDSALEQASKELSAEFEKSINETASEL
jgi:prevent-host-death family protein